MKNFLLSSLLFTSTIFAQDYQQLNNYFDSITKYNLASGTVEISKKNQPVFHREFGYTDAIEKNPINENTKIRIGSISKTFTATLILKAIEEKKIKLSTRINLFFPEINTAKKITIHNLLNHTSGIFNYTNDTLFWKTNEGEFSRTRMLTLLASYPSQFTPGVKMEYSNSGYYLLALILEQIYQKPYPEILAEKITQPLHLINTSEGNLLDPNKNEALSVYYSPLQKKWLNKSITHSSQLMGAGGIISTPKDLNLFFTSLFNGQLVNEKSLEQMKTMNFNYGYGLIEIPYNTMKGYGHTGGIDTYSSVSVYFPADSTAFSLTLNGSHLGTNDLLIAMLQAQYGDSIKKFPKEITAVAVAPSKLKLMEGTYFNMQHKLTLVVEVNEEEQSLNIKLDHQPTLTLIPTEETTFEYPLVDVKFIFQPTKNKVLLYQYGGKIEFIRK